MKILKYLFSFSLLAIMAVSCEKGIDPITPVAPGNDVATPELTIIYPVAGKPVRSQDSVATIIFKMVATDDIELQNVIIELDGVVIGTLANFKDYRRAVINFTYSGLLDGDHVLKATANDLAGKTITKDISFKKVTAPVYNPMDGEVFYLPFDDNFLDMINGNEAGIEGAPGFAEGKIGSAYLGAAESYLKVPSAGITASQFSISFWYKINGTPLRAGMISISPEGDSRNVGLRLFRENNGDNQNIGLNFGVGDTEVWMNPFITVPPDNPWMHIVISISSSKAIIYVDGVPVKETDLTAPLSWEGCPSISIGSGQPNFIYWEHFSDLSLYDELRFFNKALSQAEVTTLYELEK